MSLFFASSVDPLFFFRCLLTSHTFPDYTAIMFALLAGVTLPCGMVFLVFKYVFQKFVNVSKWALQYWYRYKLPFSVVFLFDYASICELCQFFVRFSTTRSHSRCLNFDPETIITSFKAKPNMLYQFIWFIPVFQYISKRTSWFFRRLITYLNTIM